MDTISCQEKCEISQKQSKLTTQLDKICMKFVQLIEQTNNPKPSINAIIVPILFRANNYILFDISDCSLATANHINTNIKKLGYFEIIWKLHKCWTLNKEIVNILQRIINVLTYVVG